MEVFDAATMFAISTVLLVLSAVGVNADVPDGVVYTDLRKVVIAGDNVVLKCQFHRTPLAVYWKKGNDPRSAPNLITWFGDEPPTGSCVHDGACEMTDDFSLILKEVGMEDQGRYICRVSNYKGILIHNFTDVKVIDPDQLSIHTKPYVVSWAGFSVSLPCNFTTEAKKVLWERVYWNGGRKVETILRYTSDGHEAPVARRYSWSDNYALIIRDLHVSDEGNFTCLVSTIDGIEIKNSTILAVKDHNQLSIHTDPYVIGLAGSTVILPCNFTSEAKKVLWERVYWDGGSKVETILRYTSDGHEAPPARRYSWSENYGLIIRDLRVSDEGNFTCLISTTDGIDIENSTVLAVYESATQSTTAIVVVVVITVVVILVFFIFVMIRIRLYKSFTVDNTRDEFRCAQTMTWDCFRWVFCCKKKDWSNAGMNLEMLMEQERKLSSLRKKLKEYRPGKATDIKSTKGFPEVINLGVFGVMGVGKSSFINSLNLALRNNCEKFLAVSRGGCGSLTRLRDSVPLTNHINIIDNKGMLDFSEHQVKCNLMPQIRGQRGKDPDEIVENGDVIHCPIFVHNLRNVSGHASVMRRFLKQFSSAVRDHYGRHVMVVFTHKEEAKDLKSFIHETNFDTDVPIGYMWSFENYTHDVGESIHYLKFLEKCLEIGESNIRFKIKDKQKTMPTM